MNIAISSTSQEFISKLCAKDPNFSALFQNAKEIESAKLLVDWFTKTQQMTGDQETVFLITSLHASLLNDLNNSLAVSGKKNKTKTSGWSGKAKYALLAIAGTIYFGCEGFDGVTAIMGLFSSVPTIAIFAAGTLFSLLSIIVFYSFELVEISKNLGVKSADTPKLLDVLLDEFKQIKAIRAKLSKASEKTRQQLEEDLAIASMLLKRHEALNEARAQLKLALNNPYLKAGKIVTAGLAGIIFFSGGFFAGQTVSVAIASLFVASIAVTAWPIVVASIIVALAAFSVYWFVERPGIENLISRWKGLDKEKIDELCKSKVVDQETEKLQNLINDLDGKIKSKLQIETLSKTNTEAKSQIETLSATNAETKSQIETLSTTNAEAKSQIETLSTTNKEAKSQIVELSKANVEAKLQIDELTKKLHQLTVQLEGHTKSEGATITRHINPIEMEHVTAIVQEVEIEKLPSTVPHLQTQLEHIHEIQEPAKTPVEKKKEDDAVVPKLEAVKIKRSQSYPSLSIFTAINRTKFSEGFESTPQRAKECP